ncbi:MAG: autotransporter-associated beta strand repeat-containing protein [Chthoniobacter sp.]|nr:autotransporter-associated beta strand repeat-containing protein [Chthoniobacter sp.]
MAALAISGVGFTTAMATDYYVDPSGSDANNGISAETPWRSIAKVNATIFTPGDNVLFKRGGTWVGSLSPQGSGTSLARITLGAYGTGAKPLINGNGNWAVIALSSQSYWTIDGFEVTNPASGDSSRSGIRVDASGSDTMRGIEILNNDVHDVRGIKNVNDGGRNNGGIFFWINEPGKADGVLIQGNVVKNIYGQGIAFNAEAEYMGGGMNYTNCSPNVVARGNTVMTTSGDGILMLGTDNERVEYNEVGYVGQLSDNGNNIAAAWPTRHVNGVWQFNHVHHTAALAANDSTAFDNDGFVKGTTVFQYNYTHDNAGGFLMEYTWGGDEFAQTIVRYNISWNESRVIATNRNNARIYNNVFYNPGATLDVTWTPNPSYVLFQNNLFVAAGRTVDFSRQPFMNNNFSGGVTRPVTIDGNRTQDPLFVSPNATGNLAGFILQAGSLVRNAGYVIVGNGGKDFWGVTLPGTAPHRGASQINASSDYTATPSFARLTGADVVEIPASGTNTSAFTATVRDQNFHPISNPAVTWSVSPSVAGVSIAANGTLSVSSTAVPRRIAVQATSGSVVASYSVALFSNQPITYTWGGGNGSWTDISVAGWDGGPPVGGDHAIINSGSVSINVAGVGNLGSLTVAGGTLNAYNFNGGVNTYTAYNYLILQGGTFHGAGNYNNWGAGILKNPSVSGSSPSTISASSFFNLNGTGADSSTFNVADVTGNASADLTVSAKLVDVSADQSWSPAALVKSGAGTMKLTNVNTYSGGTTINGGTLELAGTSGGTGLIKGAITVNAGATLALTGGDGTGLGFVDQLSSVTLNGGTLTAAGAIHVWNIPGGITMTGGTLQSNNGTSDPNGPQLEWNRTAVTTLASANTSTIAGRIRIRADNGYAGLTFNVADGAAATDLLVSAAVTEASAGCSLTKTGAGTLTLSGANNYTGATTVSAGTLLVSGSIATSATTVQSGATLAGTGSAGNVTLNSGATLAPGTGGIGTLSTASITLSGTLAVELSAATTDRLNASGSVALSGPLTISAAAGIAPGTAFTILSKTSAGAVSGTFAGLPQDSAFSASGYLWVISYTGGDGNDVTLTTATAQQAWRFTYFGTVQNIGTAADTFDGNGDDESNLMEFATGQNPTAATSATPALVKNGATLELTYTRSLAAMADGVAFTPEWRDDLITGAWSSAGVMEQILTDNGTTQTVRASVAVGAGSRFLHLKLSKP